MEEYIRKCCKKQGENSEKAIKKTAYSDHVRNSNLYHFSCQLIDFK